MIRNRKNEGLRTGEEKGSKGRAAGYAAALLAAFLMWMQPVQVQAVGQEEETQTEDEVKRSLSDDELDELLDFIKEKWDAGELDGEASIREAIEEGEEKFGVALKDSVKEQIADGMAKLDSLGLDHDTVIELARKLYQEHGDEIAENFQGLYEQYGTALKESVEKAIHDQVVEPAKEAAKAAVESAAKNFWQDLKNSVVSFFKNIFS